MKGCTLLQSSTWQEVFATWRSQEGADPIWQEFAKREKGWDSWQAWRTYQFGLYGNLDEWHWQLYTIDNPNSVIPAFRIGPYVGWQQHFEIPFVHTFSDLVDVAEDWVRGNVGIQDRLRNFPQGMQMIGVYIEQDDAIVLMEGHHRSAAVALAAHDGNPITCTIPPILALARYTGDPTEMFEHVMRTPSHNPNLLV